MQRLHRTVLSVLGIEPSHANAEMVGGTIIGWSDGCGFNSLAAELG